MKKLYDKFGQIVRAVSYIGMGTLFVIMLMTTVDILLRKTGTGLSVLGSYELTEMGMVILVFLGIPCLQLRRGHVSVDLLVGKLPKRLGSFYQGILMVFESAAGVYLTLGAFHKCSTLMKVGTTTAVLKVPYMPFAAVMFIGLAMYTILLVMDTLRFFIEGITYKEANHV